MVVHGWKSKAVDRKSEKRKFAHSVEEMARGPAYESPRPCPRMMPTTSSQMAVSLSKNPRSSHLRSDRRVDGDERLRSNFIAAHSKTCFCPVSCIQRGNLDFLLHGQITPLASVVKYRHILREVMMKLSEWARQNGLSYSTAHRLWRKGNLPVPAYQLPTGTILLEVDGGPAGGETVLCARPGDACDSEIARLATWATEAGFSIDRVIAEDGGLERAIADPMAKTIVADRKILCPPWSEESVGAALAPHGRRLVLADT